MVNRLNVRRLVDAAWRGMEAELAVENAATEDVINATIAIAAGGITYACSNLCGGSPEAVAKNKRAVRDALQQMLLDTADTGKVM